MISGVSAEAEPATWPRASIPGRNRPPGLASCTRTRAVRRSLSTTGSTKEIVPENASPGKDSTLKATDCPERIFLRSDSYTSKTARSEEHTSELQSRGHLVCGL